MINNTVLCEGNFVNVRALCQGDYNSIKNWGDNENNFNYFPNTNFLYDIKNPSWINSKIDDDNGLYLVIIDNENQKIIGLTLLENIDINNGIEYTSLLAMEIKGFIALLSPEFCK